MTTYSQRRSKKPQLTSDQREGEEGGGLQVEEHTKSEGHTSGACSNLSPPPLPSPPHLQPQSVQVVISPADAGELVTSLRDHEALELICRLRLAQLLRAAKIGKEQPARPRFQIASDKVQRYQGWEDGVGWCRAFDAVA